MTLRILDFVPDSLIKEDQTSFVSGRSITLKNSCGLSKSFGINDDSNVGIQVCKVNQTKPTSRRQS